MAVAGGWSPAGQASDPSKWRYDMKKGWLPPGEMGSLMGTQVHMPPDFDPKRRLDGWQMVVSPPGVQAPVGGVNYTPATKEIHAPGIPAPIDQMNLSAVPAGQNVVPQKPPPPTGMNTGGPYMQGTYTDDLARQLAQALGGWSAADPGMASPNVGVGADPEDPDGYGGSPNQNISPTNVRATAPPNNYGGYRPPQNNNGMPDLGAGIYASDIPQIAGVVAGGIGETVGGAIGDWQNTQLGAMGQASTGPQGAGTGSYTAPLPAPGTGSYTAPGDAGRIAAAGQRAQTPPPPAVTQLASAGSGVPSNGSPSPVSMPVYSPHDTTFRKYAGKYADDPEFIKIVAAGSKAESGWDAGSVTPDPTPTMPNAVSAGLFHDHDVHGRSLADRTDPDATASIWVPEYVKAYEAGKALNLHGAELASYTARYAENPADYTNPNSQAAHNYINAYNSLTPQTPGTSGAQSGYSPGAYGPPTPPYQAPPWIPIKAPDGTNQGYQMPDPNDPSHPYINPDTGNPVNVPYNPKEYHYESIGGRATAINNQDPNQRIDVGPSDQYAEAMGRLENERQQTEISRQNAATSSRNADTSARQVDQPNYSPTRLDDGSTVLVNSKTGQKVPLDDPRDKYISTDTQSGLAIIQKPDGSITTLQLPGVTGARTPAPVFGPHGQQLTYNSQTNSYDQTTQGDTQYQPIGRYLYQMDPTGAKDPQLVATAPQGWTINVDSQTGAISQINQDTGQVKELKAGRPQRYDVNGNLVQVDEQGNTKSLYQDPSKNRITLGDGTIVEYDPQSKQYVKKYTPDFAPLNLGKGHWLLPNSMRSSVPQGWIAQQGAAQNPYMGGGQYGETPKQPGNGWDVSGPGPGQGQDVGTGADVTSQEGPLGDQGMWQQNVSRPGGSSMSAMPGPTSPFLGGNPPISQQGPVQRPEPPIGSAGQTDQSVQLAQDENGNWVTFGSRGEPDSPMFPTYGTSVNTTAPPTSLNQGGYVPGQLQNPAIPPIYRHPEGWGTNPLRHYDDTQGGSVGGGAASPPSPSAPIGGPAQNPGGWTPPVPPQDVVGTGNRFGQQVDMEGIHKGLDLQAVQGTPAVSPVTGVVVAVQNKPEGLGQQVLIKDAQGQIHTLSHMDTINVQPMDQVRAGQPVGTVGSTGAGSTGPHMDYRVQGGQGEYRDPTQLAGALAQMPTVNKAPVGTGASSDLASSYGNPIWDAIGNSDGWGSGPSPADGGSQGGQALWNNPYGASAISQNPTPAATSPFASPQDASLYGPLTNSAPSGGTAGGSNSIVGAASSPGLYPGTPPGPNSLGSGTPGGFPVNIGDTPSSSTPGNTNAIAQAQLQGAAGGGQNQNQQTQQQASAIDFQKQQLAYQQQSLSQQYQLQMAQLQQQWAIHQDDAAYQRQALALQDQWKKADNALTAQQDELNRQMQLLTQGSEAQRENFAIQQSALKNPWLQQLTGMAPGWKQPGGPGNPTNPVNGITNPQGWTPNVGITGQPAAPNQTLTGAGQDVGWGAASSSTAPIINGVSGGGPQSGVSQDPAFYGGAPNGGWNGIANAPSSTSPSPASAATPNYSGGTNPQATSGAGVSPNTLTPGSSGASAGGSSASAFNPIGSMFPTSNGASAGAGAIVQNPYTDLSTGIASQLGMNIGQIANAYVGHQLPFFAKSQLEAYYTSIGKDPAQVSNDFSFTADPNAAPAGGGGGGGGTATTPALPALPDWNSYLAMTPFERAALRTQVELTGTAWEDYVNQMRDAWGNSGGPTQAPTMTALAAARQTPRDYLNNSQIAETFGNTDDEYWNQQAKGWSPAQATGVSLVA